MKNINKWIVLIICIVCLSLLFVGCESNKQAMPQRKPKTVSLSEAGTLYETPDGRSAQVGTIEANEAITYISTQEVDGVTWYEVEEGWFSKFDPTDHKGQAISYGFAKEDTALLSGAAASAAEVDRVYMGARVDIYQVRDLWGQTDEGWILMEQLYMPGHTGENSGWAVTLSTVNCYSEPTLESSRVTEYRSLYRVKFYEVFEIDNSSWGYTDSGWIDMSQVYIEGERGPGACRGTVNYSGAINIRLGPGSGYSLVRTLSNRSTVDVLFQVTVNGHNWGYIKDGWIYMEYVKISE